MSSQVLSQTPDMMHMGTSERLPPARYNLESLIADIKEHLGDSNGIDSSDVDPNYLVSLMEKYDPEPADWLRFFHNDPSKNYTRNCIEDINQKANLLLLVWNPQKGTPVHDHAKAHCVMKMLVGQICETVYEPRSASDGEAKGPLEIKSSSTYGANAVSYISDEIGLHRVHNPSQEQLAVSLHLYTPPNAVDYGYYVFDEATGKASLVQQAKPVMHNTSL